MLKSRLSSSRLLGLSLLAMPLTSCSTRSPTANNLQHLDIQHQPIDWMAKSDLKPLAPSKCAGTIKLPSNAHVIPLSARSCIFTLDKDHKFILANDEKTIRGSIGVYEAMLPPLKQTKQIVALRDALRGSGINPILGIISTRNWQSEIHPPELSQIFSKISVQITSAFFGEKSTPITLHGAADDNFAYIETKKEKMCTYYFNYQNEFYSLLSPSCSKLSHQIIRALAKNQGA